MFLRCDTWIQFGIPVLLVMPKVINVMYKVVRYQVQAMYQVMYKVVTYLVQMYSSSDDPCSEVKVPY